MIEVEKEKGEKLFQHYKMYLIIGIIGVCAILPLIFEKYLENKEGNIAVTFQDAPTNWIGYTMLDNSYKG